MLWLDTFSKLWIDKLVFVIGRHDTLHNDIQNKDTQHNDTQHKDTQHNVIQHNNKSIATLIKMALELCYAKCSLC
jgi:hypothetical protein